MANRICKMKCAHHDDDRDISEYVFSHTDIRINQKKKHPIDRYECIRCREHLLRSIHRSDRIRDHNRKQEDEAYERMVERSNKRNAKKQASIKNDIWDRVVRDKLCKGMKLKGLERHIFRDSIPKEVLQLARATMKLVRAIDYIKKEPARKLEEERERQYQKKQAEIRKRAEELEKTSIPLKKCQKHGDLFIDGVIRSGINKLTGAQLFRCQKCMKAIHGKHYQNNKEKVLDSHKKYQQENPEKYREIKNKSKRKMYALDKQKYAKMRDDFDKNNPEKKVKRQKRYKDKATLERTDVYIKQLIVQGTNLKHSDVSKEHVEIKKGLMALNKLINVEKQKEQIHVKDSEHETVKR